MIIVSIGGMSVPAERASTRWIAEMLREAGKGNALVCIRVAVDVPGAHLVLTTPACGGGPGGGRTPNDREQRILAAWRERGLEDGRVSQGELIAFLEELGRLT